MRGVLMAAAVVLCCTGWAFADSAPSDPTPPTVDTSTVQKANATNANDPPTRHDGMRRWADGSDGRNGRDRRDMDADDSNRDRGGRDGRASRDDGRQREEGFMSRRHGRMDFDRDGRDGRRGESDMRRDGRDGRDSMRGGRGERNFMRRGRGGRGGRGEQGWMRGGRGEQNFMRGGRGRQDFQRGGRGGPDFMRGGQREQSAMRGGSNWQMQGSRNALQRTSAQPKGAALGVAVTNPDAELRSQLDLPDGVGLVVQQVLPNTLASSAGLKQYDVLQKIDDQLVINPEQVEVLIKMHKQGEKISFTVMRHGKSQELTATFGRTNQRPAGRNSFAPGQRNGMNGMRRFNRPGPGFNGMGPGNRGPRNNGNTPPPPRPSQQEGPKTDGASTPTPTTQPSPTQAATVPNLLRQFADLFVD